MRNRRGTTVIASDLRKQMSIFSEGDIVTSVVSGSIDFIGQIVSLDYKCSKISVNWGGGEPSQHDPDEIQLYPVQSSETMAKMMMASRRGRFSEEDVPAGDQFVGDPKTHGIDHPRGGGFSIMQQLQKDLAPEIKEEAEAGPKIAPQEPEEVVGDGGDQNKAAMTRRGRVASITETIVTTWEDDGSIAKTTSTDWDADSPDELEEAGMAALKQQNLTAGFQSRRALYWGGPGRVYRQTRGEQGEGTCNCPKCKGQMEKQPFTKSEKLYSCPECGFKVPSGNLTTKKVEIEIEPDGTVEVGVEGVPVAASSCRRGRWIVAEVPDNLNQMSLSDIARLIYEDWGRKVNYAAKPYLEAMSSLRSIKDDYGMDSGMSIVAYFLSNASSWRGEVAKAVKKELKRRLR